MKLGIAVVYLVPEGNEPLLDLHLDRVVRHTGVPFTIYGAVNRPTAWLARKLSLPFARICEVEPTDRRGPAEHAYYLDRLLLEAVRDGATHLSTLHVDSFPVRDGWAEALAGQLAPTTPFAAAVRNETVDFKPFTAAILARADFLESYRPTLLLAPEEAATRAYRRYRRTFPHHPDSGVGWGFTAWREGLGWLPLTRSNRGQDHAHFGTIHGDIFFHLGAASWTRKDFPGSVAPTAVLRWRARLAPALRRLLPAWAKEGLKDGISRRLPLLDNERTYRANEEEFLSVKARLLADPEGYLRFLRSGSA
jgi:hypothetical protein